MKKIALLQEIREAVLPDGRHIRLDHNEAVVLRRLIGADGHVVSRAVLNMAIMGPGEPSSRFTVAVYIMRLRKKIGRRRIVTVSGAGYRLAEVR